MSALPGLYIHIPFCKSKCAYCAFASYAGCADLIGPYLKKLSCEAALYKNKFKPKTLYIGGGTPSLLDCAQISSLIDIVEKNFVQVKNFEEATFECNPESLTEDKIKLLKAIGFTRLSIGMQAMDDKHLKLIGRAHNKKQFLQVYKTAQKYFDTLNIDIIAALPEQNIVDFKNGLAAAVKLGPKHLSVYGLMAEEGAKLFAAGFTPDDDLCRKMLEHAADYLTARGYGQYEISNFAQKGFESLHNINYWRGGEYLGLGCAAASYIKGTRRCNTGDLQEYTKAKKPKCESERLTGKPKLGEQIILGLRMLNGITLTAPQQKAFSAEIKKLVTRGLLLKDGKKIKLTGEGKYMANEVWRHFVEPF